MNVVDMALKNNYSVQTNSNNKNKDKKRIRKNTICSVAGSAIGITASVAGIYTLAKKKNPQVSLKNLTYDEKDILAIGAGSVLGGLIGGLVSDKKEENKIPKLREASLQFFGSLACPLGILSIANKALDKSKFELPKIKGSTKTIERANVVISALPKIAVTFASLVAGMNVGNKIMNKVNNKIFHQEENRKVETSDYLVHTDDICIAASLLLKDSKTISAITSKALPASFILAGAKTGTRELTD